MLATVARRKSCVCLYAVGIEIEEKYCEIAKQRIGNLMPLFNINTRIEKEKSEDEVGDE